MKSNATEIWLGNQRMTASRAPANWDGFTPSPKRPRPNKKPKRSTKKGAKK